MSRRMSAKLVVFMLFISLTIVGCGGQQNKNKQENETKTTESDQVIVNKANQQETSEIGGKTAKQYPEIFIQMLENNPLHRSGAISPDNRYYAYEERSSIILVQLPTAEEYLADRTMIPKVLFTDGIRKDAPFTELENDYTKRLKQPLLTEEELQKAELELRSVYKWDFFYYQQFSQDGRYLGYLREQNFGSNRTCMVHVLDLQDNCRLYSLPVKERSQYPGIKWQADSETLEIYLPSAERVDEGVYLELRRQWHIPSGQSKLKYFADTGSDDEKEISLEEVQKAIAAYDQVEAEQKRAEEKWSKLTVEELVAALKPAELTEEYKRYFSLQPGQLELLKERGYSDEAIAEMDSYDFQQEELSWLISKELTDGAKRNYPELKDQDLSNWPHQKYNEYIRVQSEKNNAPPDAIKKEILERGLPEDINSGVAKEFHGWENMLAYTNEAIIAMYEARQGSEALFRKGEAYRLAVRAAYLREVKG